MRISHCFPNASICKACIREAWEEAGVKVRVTGERGRWEVTTWGALRPSTWVVGGDAEKKQIIASHNLLNFYDKSSIIAAQLDPLPLCFGFPRVFAKRRQVFYVSWLTATAPCAPSSWQSRRTSTGDSAAFSRERPRRSCVGARLFVAVLVRVPSANSLELCEDPYHTRIS